MAYLNKCNKCQHNFEPSNKFDLSSKQLFCSDCSITDNICIICAKSLNAEFEENINESSDTCKKVCDDIPQIIEKICTNCMHEQEDPCKKCNNYFERERDYYFMEKYCSNCNVCVFCGVDIITSDCSDMCSECRGNF